MTNKIRSLAFVLAILLVTPVIHAADHANESRWEPAIRRFERIDKKAQPPKKATLFIGSSSIRLWDLDKFFPDLKTINRGFGGSEVSDSLEFADRIILPYKPKTIVFYAGDNDIAAGKSAAQVFADYKALVKKIHDARPKTTIIYIAIKPSIARWKLVDEMRKANKLIQDFSSKDKRLSFLDIDTPMIGEDGKPRPELFAKDGLHLNEKGYRLWTDLLMPHLKK